jgi:hypothetical protein
MSFGYRDNRCAVGAVIGLGGLRRHGQHHDAQRSEHARSQHGYHESAPNTLVRPRRGRMSYPRRHRLSPICTSDNTDARSHSYWSPLIGPPNVKPAPHRRSSTTARVTPALLEMLNGCHALCAVDLRVPRRPWLAQISRSGTGLRPLRYADSIVGGRRGGRDELAPTWRRGAVRPHRCGG